MTNGYCVYHHSPAHGAGSVCEPTLTNQYLVYCCSYDYTPIKHTFTSHRNGVYNYCAIFGKGKMCDMYDFVQSEKYGGITVDTGDTGMAWTNTECTTTKECEYIRERHGQTLYSDWYDWHQMNDTTLIQFLLATLILFCVANLCVFVRRKLRRRPRYAALNKVADSDTDPESILINN